MISQLEIARFVATIAHMNQYRKDGKTPYIIHPLAVAESLKDEDETTQCIALLHDALEDNKLLNREVFMAMKLNAEIYYGVLLLTKCEKQVYKDYIKSICVSKNIRAIKVKIADIEHNLSCNPSKKSIEKYNYALPLLKEALEETINNLPLIHFHNKN